MNNKAIDRNRKTEGAYPTRLTCTRPRLQSPALHKWLSGLCATRSLCLDCQSKQEGRNSKVSLARQQFEALAGLYETPSVTRPWPPTHAQMVGIGWQPPHQPHQPHPHLCHHVRHRGSQKCAPARSSVPNKVVWRLWVEGTFRGFLAHLLISKSKLRKPSPFPRIIRGGGEKDSVFQHPS